MEGKKEISKEIGLEEVKFDHEAVKDVNVEGKEAPEPKTEKEEDDLRAAAFQYQMVLDQASRQILGLLKDKLGSRKKRQAAGTIENSLRMFAEAALKMTEAYVKTKDINSLENYIKNLQGYFQAKWLIDIDPVKATKKEIKEAKVEFLDFNAAVVEEEAAQGLQEAEKEEKENKGVDSEVEDEGSN